MNQNSYQMNNIIKKEKARQEKYLRLANSPQHELSPYLGGKISSHKQSLINLKEYLEGLHEAHHDHYSCCTSYKNCANLTKDSEDWKWRCSKKMDIEELNKMIKRYE